MGVLSPSGEIADFTEADQFQPSKTQYACGYFAVAVCRSMAQVGSPPTLTAAQVIADGEAWYAQYDGNTSISNTAGMSLGQLYAVLVQVGLHYQETTPNAATVRAWLNVGYPVLLTITEVSVHDLALGDTVPYPWTPAGNHIITATGVRSDENVLVRDTANCTNLYDPNSLRPGPRSYDAAKLVILEATVAVPPWLPRPASSTPPTVAPQPNALPFTAFDLHVWTLVKSGIPTNTGIAQEWLRARQQHGIEIGPPLEAEWVLTVNGVTYSIQRFAGAEAWWNHTLHECVWKDARGSFTIPK